MKFISAERALDFLNRRITDDSLHRWTKGTISKALRAAKPILDATDFERLSILVYDGIFCSASRHRWPISADAYLDAEFDRVLCRNSEPDDGLFPFYDGDQFLGGSKDKCPR